MKRSPFAVFLAGLVTLTLAGCSPSTPAPTAARAASGPGSSSQPTAKGDAGPSRPSGPEGGAPCFIIPTEGGALRAADAAKVVESLTARVRLPPQDEVLRRPRSLDDIRTAIRRDVVYVFADAARYARSLESTEGRFSEATLELLLGESQLVAAQVLNAQESWVGTDLRMARANLAGEAQAANGAVSDRVRMLSQLVRVVEEGNRISDALGTVAPGHLQRGAEVIRLLKREAPSDPRTSALSAEYHRLRGEWPEFESAMRAAEAAEKKSAPLCYLRAMEQVERLRRPDAAAKALRECLGAFPRFVRAQAALVVLAPNVTEGLREMDVLRRMNPDHYLVMLLEPTLMADQELTRMQSHAAK